MKSYNLLGILIGTSLTFLVYAASQEVITLDEASSRLEAPQSGDTYKMPREVFIYDTTATSTANEALNLWRDSASPADNDYLAELLWDGENDTSQQTTYTKMGTQILDQTDGTEDGSLYASTMTNGALVKSLKLDILTTSLGNGSLLVDIGQNNTALGVNAGNAQANANDDNNTWVGFNSGLVANGSASGGNTGVGSTACDSLTTGNDNTCIGWNADLFSATQSGGVAIGPDAVAGETAIAIGHNADAPDIWSIAIGGHDTDASSADAGANGAIAIGIASDATGTSSVAVGFTAQATTGSSAISIGGNTDATGANCIAIGGHETDASSANCSGAQSVALQGGQATDIGELAYTSDFITTAGDAQTSVYVLNNQTTDATANVELFTNGATGTGRISIASDSTAYYDCKVTGRRTDADNESGGYSFEGVIDNNAGTTALVGSQVAGTPIEDTAGWAVQITADNTNDSLKVDVTGVAANTINWVARCEIVKVKG